MKKAISVILMLAVLLTFAVPYAFAADSNYKDVNGHWAAASITKWSDQGVITGYDGKFNPDSPITRGDFAVILDRLMDYQTAAKNGFSDLSEAYYTDALLKVNFAKVINGYTDGTMKPTQNISRQEAFVMIARAFQLTAPAGYSLKATDAKDVASYATSAIAALEAGGSVQGRDGGKLYPAATITRAEIVKLIDGLVSNFIVKAGTYTTLEKTGNVVINAPGVTLKNVTVSGNLIIAPGVADGDLILDNTKVTGNVVVLGGGVNSIKFVNGSDVTGDVIVKKVDGKVRIYTAEGVELKTVEVKDGKETVVLEGKFKSVTVETSVTVTLPKGTTVDTMDVKAVSNISGEGKITTANIAKSADGSVFEQKPTNIKATEAVTISVGGSTYTASGDSIKEITDQPTGGGGGGGGTTTATVSSVRLNYKSAEGEKWIAAVYANGKYVFDLRSLDGKDVLLSVNVMTNIKTTISSGDFAINTNEDVDLNQFFAFFKQANKVITLDKLRAVNFGYEPSGMIGNGGGEIKIGFIIVDAPAYTMTNDGTTIVANLEAGAGTLITEANVDPVDFMKRAIDNKGNSTVYNLEVYYKGAVTPLVSKTIIGFNNIEKEMNLTALTNKLGVTTLGELSGFTAVVKYGGTTLTLKFA